MSGDLNIWYESFRKTLNHSEFADPLRSAALGRHLRLWTQVLAKVVVSNCQTMGWSAVAKEQQGTVLPVSRQEYLGLDVTAFEGQLTLERLHWRLPVAIFELENREDLNIVAYSLWKVCVVRSRLKGVFCYRHNSSEIPALLQYLAQSVMSELSTEDSTSLLVVVGTRAKAETFPDGFFQPYYWDKQWRKFSALL